MAWDMQRATTLTCGRTDPDAGEGSQGGILSMESNGKVPAEAFEIPEKFLNPLQELGIVPPEGFSFVRCTRRSILQELGIVPASGKEAGGTTRDGDTMNPYSKMDAASVVVVYMCFTVSPATMSLPRAVAVIGWVPGLAVLVGLSCFTGMLTHLLAGLPQLMQSNFETFADIGRACFKGWIGHVIVPVLCIMCWWTTCTFNLMLFRYQLWQFRQYWQDFQGDMSDFSVSVKVMFVCPAMIFLCRARAARARQLNRAIKYGLNSILGAVAISSLCAACHAIYSTTPWGDGGPRVFAWRRGPFLETHNFCVKQDKNAITLLALGFAGVGILPFALAEMLHPSDTQKVVSKANVRVGAISTCTGVLCYLSWGDELCRASLFKEMLAAGWPHSEFGAILAVLFCVRAISAYPINFWPLLREIENMIKWHEVPAIELRLPWALRWQAKAKVTIRVTLALLTVVPALVLDFDQSKLFKGIWMCICMTVHFLLPAAVIGKGLLIHRQRLEERAVTLARLSKRSEGATGEAPQGQAQRSPYFGGCLATHTAGTVVVVVVSLILTINSYYGFYAELV